MIELTCTNCKAVLSIDDAFAGGVCRCRHCGAIQTVPSRLRTKAGAAVAVGKSGAKTLYQNPSRSQLGSGVGSGTGLEELASVVASSSGLSSGRLRRAATQQKGAFRRFSPAVAAAALVLAFVGSLLVWSLWGHQKRAPQSAGISGGQSAHVTVAKPPEFCGVPLDDRVIIYVIDRGSATGDVFGHLKEACYKSIESLGPDRKFQIVFWNNGTDVAYPNSGPTFANPANLEAARRALDEVSAHGQSDVTPALTRAIEAKPGTIVLATGKGYELDDSFVDVVERIRGGSDVKISTFAVGPGEPGSALKSIALRTGGRFAAVPTAALRDAAE
jgi:hypothetical protein